MAAIEAGSDIDQSARHVADVPILLQKSWEVATAARIESESRLQRIKVALLFIVANQYCAPEPAKYFCSSICHEQTPEASNQNRIQ
jgi:hypothetical protein